MITTKIPWADSTWNPVTGCRHECPYCYAKAWAHRFGGYEPRYGASLTQNGNGTYELGENEKKYRLEKNGKKSVAPYPFGFEPTLHRYRLDQPQKWVKPRNIFVCSMADLFGNWVPDGWIKEVMTAADKATQHRYLFLTKNPFRYSNYGVPQDENKWYGTSVTAEKEVTRMNMLHAKNNFISIEPLMEDLKPEQWGRDYFDRIRWIIIGAETGSQAGKTAPQKEWVDKIARQADKHGIPVFMKDSLIKAKTLTEKEMRREFPWGESWLAETAKELLANPDQAILAPAGVEFRYDRLPIFMSAT